MKVRPSILIIQDKKLLLMRYNYGGQDVFGLPGGNPDESETLENTLIRELKEELNIQIEVGQLALVGEVIFPEKHQSTLHCLFLGHVTAGAPQLNPAETTALECLWVDLTQLDSLNLYPNVGAHIQNVVHQKPQNVYVGLIPQNWY